MLTKSHTDPGPAQRRSSHTGEDQRRCSESGRAGRRSAGRHLGEECHTRTSTPHAQCPQCSRPQLLLIFQPPSFSGSCPRSPRATPTPTQQCTPRHSTLEDGATGFQGQVPNHHVRSPRQGAHGRASSASPPSMWSVMATSASRQELPPSRSAGHQVGLNTRQVHFGLVLLGARRVDCLCVCACEFKISGQLICVNGDCGALADHRAAMFGVCSGARLLGFAGQCHYHGCIVHVIAASTATAMGGVSAGDGCGALMIVSQGHNRSHFNHLVKCRVMLGLGSGWSLACTVFEWMIMFRLFVVLWL